MTESDSDRLDAAPPLADALRDRLRRDGEMVPAGLLRRAAAAAIDFVFGLVIGLALVSAIEWAMLPRIRSGGSEKLLVAAATVLIAVALPSAFPGSFDTPTTLGKRLLDLVVTDLREQPVGWGRALGRIAARIALIGSIGAAMIIAVLISNLIAPQLDWFELQMGLIAIGHAIQPLTPRRQAIYDLAAGTRVLQRPTALTLADQTPANQTFAAGEGEP